MPYQAGFQPQGVRRDRSDEFMEQRRKCGEARKLDEGRLARRLEKVRLPFLSPSFQCVYVTPPLNLFGSCSSWRFISRPKTCTRKNPQR
jgi:hypothetical protein